MRCRAVVTRQLRATVCVLSVSIGVACAPVVKRDLSKIPAGQVGFDDLCDLQAYFDVLAAKRADAPAVVESSEVNGSRPGRTGGRARFEFSTAFQRQTITRVLGDNWRRLPEGLANAPRIDVDVRWSEKASVRRVVTTEDATLMVGAETVSLPYHVCLSELLFGEALYARRRDMLGLAPVIAGPALSDAAEAPSVAPARDRDGGSGESSDGPRALPDAPTANPIAPPSGPPPTPRARAW
jgi:hypothetical protein